MIIMKKKTTTLDRYATSSYANFMQLGYNEDAKHDLRTKNLELGFHKKKYL